MKTNAYSIYDRKALVYNLPYFAANHGLAIRSLSDLASDLSTSVGRHPSDFVLYWVGVYDDGLGQLLPIDPLVHVSDVTPLVKVNRDFFNQGGEPPKS